MPQNVKSTQNKVRFLIQKIFLEKSGHGFSRTHIIKILFKFKKILSNKYPDDPILEQLPFYWYRHGPMCDPIDNEFNDMRDSGELKYIGHDKYILQKGLEYSNNGLEPHTTNEFKIFLKSINPYGLEELSREIYKGSPCYFYEHFKYGFLKPVEELTKVMKNGQQPL